MSKYQYQIIRHNYFNLPGGFINVGIVFYSHEALFYKCKFLDEYSGIMKKPSLDDKKQSIISLLKEFEINLNTSFKKIRNTNLHSKVEDIDVIISSAFPKKGNTLTCSEIREANSDNLELAFEDAFYRNIENISIIYSQLRLIYSLNLFESVNIPHWFVMNDEDYQAKYSIFSKVEFEYGATFRNTDLKGGVLFKECIFWAPVRFIGIKTTSVGLMVNYAFPDNTKFSQSLNYEYESIIFTNCIFKANVIFEVDKKEEINSLFSHLLFKNCTFEKGLEINSLNIIQGNISLENCTINETLDISDLDLIKSTASGEDEKRLTELGVNREISFLNNKVKGATKLSNINCSSLRFNDSNEFNGSINIQTSNFSNNLRFDNTLFKEQVTLKCIETPGLQVLGATFEKTVIIYYYVETTFKLEQIELFGAKPPKGISTYYFLNAKFLNGIYIYGNNYEFAPYPLVDEINLNLSAELKGNIEFRNLEVGLLKMNGTNTYANIYLQNLKINQIIIKGLINNAGLIFSRIRPSYVEWFNVFGEQKNKRVNTISIEGSNFGKAQFFETDFESFSSIYFSNNILTEITTSGVKWFNPEQLHNKFESDYENKFIEAKKSSSKIQISVNRKMLIDTYLAQKEIYRQLKFSSQRQSDIASSLEFQRWEMDFYRKIVYLKRPRDWSEIIILWLSQTNNYGQSWLKALKLFIICSFVCYLPLGFFNSSLLNYSKFAHSFHEVLFNFRVVLWENLKYWFVLMNPAHSLKDLFGESTSISGWFYFWDVIARIVISYFIFQIITGFRKFVNK